LILADKTDNARAEEIPIEADQHFKQANSPWSSFRMGVRLLVGDLDGAMDSPRATMTSVWSSRSKMLACKASSPVDDPARQV
jgi:hypothetical protein